jgi:aspartyl-tRNA(Asn)/glutamyl-tRNA(Gln) amidotransferase subunit B
MAWEAVIGLEIHVRLATGTKLFCRDRTVFGAPPNTQVCPVCLGLPGALPVTNGRAVELAVRTALGLGCTVHDTSRFARKSYFYPDLPKGYQITQWQEPLATGGALDLSPAGGATGPTERVRIRRLHLEEDAGRLDHERFADTTAVDLNRAGIPLVEIVTEPDLRTPESTRAFLVRLKQTLLYLGVSDCDMAAGSLRVDANISVRTAGDVRLGARTELKNLNSFGNVERALTYEITRQVACLDAGHAVESATLAWDEADGRTRALRSKEGTGDYRYFNEPDLPPLVVSPAVIEEMARSLPELPGAKERRLCVAFGLTERDAAVLAADRHLADYYEEVAGRVSDAKAAANWVIGDVLRWVNRRDTTISDLPLPAGRLAELIGLVLDGTISRGAGRKVLGMMLDTGRPAADLVAAHDLARVADPARMGQWVDDVITRYPREVERCRAGDTKLLDFLMGRLMNRSAGRADPVRGAALLRERLGS